MHTTRIGSAESKKPISQDTISVLEHLRSARINSPKIAQLEIAKLAKQLEQTNPAEIINSPAKYWFLTFAIAQIPIDRAALVRASSTKE